jgi:hypothetical protein
MARVFYRLERLIQGTYRIQVEKAGFKTFVSMGVPVSEAQTVRVNPNLEVGAETQKVEVVETLPLLQTESPQSRWRERQGRLQTLHQRAPPRRRLLLEVANEGVVPRAWIAGAWVRVLRARPPE